MQLAGQPLQQASCLFDHDSVESQLEQFVHRKLTAAIFECDDDAIDSRLRPGKSLQGSIERLFALVLVGQYTIPADDVHTCVFARPEQFHDRLRSFAGTENIDSFAEHLPSDDPFVGAAPRHQRRCKKYQSQQQNVVGDIDVGKHDR